MEKSLLRISRECGKDAFCDVKLLSRIAPRCMAVLSSTGFSLCDLNGGQSTIHRLKPVLLVRAGTALQRPAVKPAGGFQRVLVRIASKCRDFYEHVLIAQ